MWNNYKGYCRNKMKIKIDVLNGGDFLEDLKAYLFQPEKLEDIANSAKIVIDTNVLLAAYQYRNITFSELIDMLLKLHEQERLLVPSHVIKEFFKNRPDRIVEIIQTVQQMRDGLPDIKKISKMEDKIPSMEYLSNYKEIQSSEESINSLTENYKTSLKEYRNKLSSLMEELKLFFNDDPILKKYEKIFRECFYKPDDLPEHKEIIEEFKERAKAKLPPGYKDGKKVDNGEGDFIIWKHILEIKDSHVIFITADNKNDWVYRDSNGNVISARRELVEEFYEVNEKSFCIAHPTTFMKVFKPTIDNEVIEDMNAKLDSKEYSLDQAIEALNEKGSSLLTNSKQDELYKLLKMNFNVDRYIKGTNYYLDLAIQMAALTSDKTFLDELLRKANAIAREELTESEKQEKFTALAQWAYTVQPD